MTNYNYDMSSDNTYSSFFLIGNYTLSKNFTIQNDGETYPTSFKMKGAFLTTDTGFVLGYSINQYTLEITTQMIFEKDLTFFDIVEVVSDGE